jgi:hypothetical protein
MKGSISELPFIRDLHYLIYYLLLSGGAGIAGRGR